MYLFLSLSAITKHDINVFIPSDLETETVHQMMRDSPEANDDFNHRIGRDVCN